MATKNDALKVYSMPGTARIPSISPFCMKLETHLHMAGVRFETEHVLFDRSPNGRLPFIEHGDVVMPESERIIRHVARTWGVDLDAGLSGRERHQSLLVRLSLEETLRMVRTWETFCIDENFERAREYLRAFIPASVFEMAIPQVKARQLEKLDKHGILELSRDEVEALGCAVVDAVADALGARPFLHGDRPTGVDAVIYGFLATEVRGVV
ncbi:MAG: glutathione S-transferase family protein, partial [Myxococcales bacterium]|nr:glutathione S-transferase family protein [Myxococcales bacterium]